MITLLLATLLALPSGGGSVPFEKISFRYLPELNIPRAEHRMLCVDGELTVFGGHTEGFIPTGTVEYYRNGRWHLLNSLYTHDAPVAVQMPEGGVMLGGGYSDNFGIGQTYAVESYEPESRSFSPRPIMEQKRTNASALSMPGSGILIAGNWYASDLVELWMPGSGTALYKPSAQQRNHPYILLTGADEAIVFGPCDERGRDLQPIIADRLHGEPFIEPLLQEWRPLSLYYDPVSGVNFIGDESKGDYTYLIAGRNFEGETAILQVHNGEFSLFPLKQKVPSTGPWGRIVWDGQIHADRSAGFGLLTGRDDSGRLYLLKIEWGGVEAGLTVFWTEPLPCLEGAAKCLLDGGRMVLSGGCHSPSNTNYNPMGTVVLLELPDMAGTAGAARPGWWLLCAGLLLLGACASMALFRKRRKTAEPEGESVPEEKADAGLYAQIVELFEKEQVYKRPDLKMSDVATALCTNTRYISSAINESGVSFVEFMNRYRIEFAKTLMQDAGRLSMDEIAEESGFASKVSFYRNFKKLTGKTPSQWLKGLQANNL